MDLDGNRTQGFGWSHCRIERGARTRTALGLVTVRIEIKGPLGLLMMKGAARRAELEGFVRGDSGDFSGSCGLSYQSCDLSELGTWNLQVGSGEALQPRLEPAGPRLQDTACGWPGGLCFTVLFSHGYGLRMTSTLYK